MMWRKFGWPKSAQNIMTSRMWIHLIILYDGYCWGNVNTLIHLFNVCIDFVVVVYSFQYWRESFCRRPVICVDRRMHTHTHKQRSDRAQIVLIAYSSSHGAIFSSLCVLARLRIVPRLPVFHGWLFIVVCVCRRYEMLASVVVCLGCLGSDII